MSFLLDTNIISAHFRRPAGLAHRFFQYSGRLSTSTVVLSELYAWAFRRDNPSPLLAKIEGLLEDVQLLDYGRSCALAFGRLRIVLQRSGVTVSPQDLMIAATALAHDLTLVTHNRADFEKIPDLRQVDWLNS